MVNFVMEFGQNGHCAVWRPPTPHAGGEVPCGDLPHPMQVARCRVEIDLKFIEGCTMLHATTCLLRMLKLHVMPFYKIEYIRVDIDRICS